MFRKTVMTAVIVSILSAPAAFAANGNALDRLENRHGESAVIDRIEDRHDRRESIRDEAVDNGLLDVIEDHIDRAESRKDRRD